jgi:uncharacterized protein YndB with AHSA1/START domain
MRSNTQSVSLPGRPEDVFAFLADPENLPRWAVGFCRSIRRDDAERWTVETPSGEVPVRYVTNAPLGTIDFHMDIAPAAKVVAYSRVIANGEGAEYVFTQFQAAGMPDAVFDGQVSALAEELHVLQAIFRARSACPA